MTDAELFEDAVGRPLPEGDEIVMTREERRKLMHYVLDLQGSYFNFGVHIAQFAGRDIHIQD